MNNENIDTANTFAIARLLAATNLPETPDFVQRELITVLSRAVEEGDLDLVLDCITDIADTQRKP